MSLQDLGPIGVLSVDVVPNICQNLTVQDMLNFRNCNKQIGEVIEETLPRMIRNVRVQVYEKSSTVCFIHRRKDMVSTFDMSKTNNWKTALLLTTSLKDVELDFDQDASTSQIFSILSKPQFRLRSLKVNIRNGGKNDFEKTNRIHRNCISLVIRHRSTISQLEISTADGQKFCAEATTKLQVEYTQGAEPKNSEHMEHNKNYALAYSMFHSLVQCRPYTDVTLVIEPTFNANLALQKAFQIAVPHANRKALNHLTVKFGASLRKLDEEEVPQVLLRHVDEFHFTTPNLQNFVCLLPLESIEPSTEELSKEIREQVSKSRRSPTPYNPSICLRPVSCK